MSEHLILQQDNPDFPLDPQLLIHAMWKELFDLKIMDFVIWPFEYFEGGNVMFPIAIKNCNYEFVTPQETELYDMHDSMPELTIGFPDWVERLQYADGPQIIQYLNGPPNNPFDEVLEQTYISESYTWPWILWSFHEAEQRNEIVLGIGKVVVDVLEESELQNALAKEEHGILSQHLTALPVAKPGPAFEGFVYSGNESAEAPSIIQSFLDLELELELDDSTSTPDNNVYSHALMLFAVHPASTLASLELIAESTSVAREFLQFNPSITPDVLAKIQ
jgi:hypothetical protein